MRWTGLPRNRREKSRINAESGLRFGSEVEEVLPDFVFQKFKWTIYLFVI